MEHDYYYTSSSSDLILMNACRPPERWDTFRLSEQIIGQPIAVDRLSRQLNDWTTKHHHGKKGAPLIVYVTGGESVGKRHLAHTLTKHFVGNNCNCNDIFFEIASNNHDEKELYQQMLNHVTDYPEGSVILWPNVDEDNDESNQDLVVPILNQIQDATTNDNVFGNSIIVLTSSVGNTSVLYKLLRKHGRKELPIVEMESFLLYEIMEAHSSPSSSSSSAAAAKKEINDPVCITKTLFCNESKYNKMTSHH